MIRIEHPQVMIKRFHDFVALKLLRHIRVNAVVSLADCGVYCRGLPFSQTVLLGYSETWDIDGVEVECHLTFETGEWTMTSYPPSLDRRTN